jgi:hypothetical protein
VCKRKSNATLPTLSNESICLTSVIDAMEIREVSITAIQGDFMQADIDAFVHVRIAG